MRSTRALSFFVCALLLIVATGTTTVCSAQERIMGGVGITVFADPEFRGKSATYREDVPNLDPLGLNDKVSSLRVGPGERWEICEHADYQGRCVVVSGDESDLRRNAWNDLISSFRRVRGGSIPPPPSQGDAYIVLYDRPTYRGTPANYDSPKSDLYLFNRRAESVTIGRGVWELCEGRNYTGRCVVLDQSVPDLITLNFRDRVSSVRPVRPRPSPQPSDWYVVLFDRANYRGTPTNYQREETDLNKKARSVTIGRGVWQLCDGRDFNGRCVTLDRSVPDLNAYNLGNRVRSLRPLFRQPR